MDPEFQRILLRVVAIGGIIGVVGFAGVFLAFRSFGELSGRRPPKPVFFVVLAFIVVSCLVLLRFALIR